MVDKTPQGASLIDAHRALAALMPVLQELRATDRSRIEVAVPGTTTRHHHHVQVHGSRALDRAKDVTTIRGIPVTTMNRTLLNLANVLEDRPVERALDQAEITDRLEERMLALCRGAKVLAPA